MLLYSNFYISQMLKKSVLTSCILILLPAMLYSQDRVQQISPEDEARAMEYYIDGLAAFENEEYQQAIDLLNLAYLRIPDSSGVNYAMADAYLELRDYVNAEYYAKVAVEIEPDNKWYHLKLAEIYSRSGQPYESVQALENSREYLPDERMILIQLAALYTELREFEESNRIYDEILSARGPNIQIHRRKYQNYIQMENQQAALEELQRMRSLEPDNLNTLHTISRLFTEMEDFESAVEILTEAKQRNPRNPETLILLADIYVNRGEWESLGDTFISMIEDPLLTAGQKMELARFLYLQHQSAQNQPVLTRETQRVLESFSNNEPEFGEAHLLAAEFYLNQGNQDEAIEKLELANQVQPEDSEAWRQRIQLIFSAGDYEQVIEAGIRATEFIDDDAFINFFVGASYMLTDQNIKAAEWLESATMLPSRRDFRSIVHGTLGDVYADLDRWDDAVETYETALQLDSSNHNAMNNYAYFMSIREERLDYAEELALRAIRYEPENAAYLDTVGWIYFKKGEYEKAREYIQSSIDTGDASAEVYEHMGDVYEKLGQSDDARNWWQKAFEADPDRTYLQERLEAP
jgi:tetratricopeptide (TPR) repeat protein